MEKHIMVTGTSKVSWKDAIVQTIAEASKTIDYLTGVTVVNQKNCLINCNLFKSIQRRPLNEYKI